MRFIESDDMFLNSGRCLAGTASIMGVVSHSASSRRVGAAVMDPEGIFATAVMRS